MVWFWVQFVFSCTHLFFSTFKQLEHLNIVRYAGVRDPNNFKLNEHNYVQNLLCFWFSSSINSMVRLLLAQDILDFFNIILLENVKKKRKKFEYVCTQHNINPDQIICLYLTLCKFMCKGFCCCCGCRCAYMHSVFVPHPQYCSQTSSRYNLIIFLVKMCLR